MEFKQATKISIGIIAVVGVIGLIYRLFVEGDFGFGTTISATDDFGRLNLSRIFLLAWETFWLTSIAFFFIYVSKRASNAKTEEEIAKLENFEPKLFRIVIGLLILAALLTLVLPTFFQTNAIPQFQQDNDGTYVQVSAATFQFTINGKACTPAQGVSCAEFETGVNYIFNATSVDTTHGFTIYDTHEVLLMQGQIVPGYATRISFTFDAAGEYTIRCAEYCGAGHHVMLASFTVVEGSN